MKNYFLILTFIILSSFSNALMGAEGIVLVLEAPLLFKPDLESPISTFVRKGEKIYIHDKNIGHNTEDVLYDNAYKKVLLNQGPKGAIFYQSLDKQGNSVWIEKKYVKMIYKDERELKEPISPFKYDPKDYRIYEPIPPKYPFYQMDRRRFVVTYGLGFGNKNNYSYPTSISQGDYSSRHGLNFLYLKKVDFDVLDRFYYGFNFHLYGESNTFTLSNGMSSNEMGGQVGLGPAITYDAYKRQNLQITFTAAITYNYNYTLVDQEGALGSEERGFSSFTLTPKIGSYVLFKDALPSLSVVLGSEIQFNYSNSASNSGGQVYEDIWNGSDDNVNNSMGGTFAFYLGFQQSN